MISNIIDKVRDRAAQERDVDKIKGVMIHRCGVDLQTGVCIGYDGQTIAEAFIGRNPRWAEVAKATGRQNAYTFFVGGNLGDEELDGQIWQALPLDEIGHHARRFSSGYLGIGLVGDFREKQASRAQLVAAVTLTANICLFLGLESSSVVGHGEVKGAHGGGKAPGAPAACPGDLLNMFAFRLALESEMRFLARRGAKWYFRNSGASLP